MVVGTVPLIEFRKGSVLHQRDRRRSPLRKDRQWARKTGTNHGTLPSPDLRGLKPLVGYTQFRQDMTGLGCRQIANKFSDCVPFIPVSVRGITEDEKWQALRLGATADVAIAARLTLAGDGTYLPYVKFTGTDDHILRDLVSPEHGEGTGVQLEATLSYDVTDALSLGIGGRYWSMWTTSGTVNFGGTGTIVPMRYAAEQAHLLLQGTYTFGASEPASHLK